MLSCFSCVQHFATHQAPLSEGFSKWEYCSGLTCLPPGDLPDPGSQLESLNISCIEGRFFTTSTTSVQRSSIQLLSRVWLFATPWTAARQASLSMTNFQSLFKRIHQVSGAIQPSHPLSSPSPSTFNLFQHQGLFQWVSSSHQVAKLLEFQLQQESFQWIFRTDFL